MTHDSVKNLFYGKIVERFCLNKEETERPTWHIVIDLRGSAMRYKPGDNLAIMAENDPALVEEILSKLPSEAHLGRDQLLKKIELPHDPFEKTSISEWLPLRPRLYSIASSQEACPGFAHLIVSERPCLLYGKKKEGVCSSFLCRRAEVGKTPIGLFLQPSRHTLFPSGETLPRIMIAAGTGIAPFRAFLQQEHHLRRPLDRYWLIFGEKRKNSDFFYEDFWNELSAKGLHFATAFSRDAAEKRYVQHTLLDHKNDLFSWLESGASVYVCGSLEMGQAVESALLQLIEDESKTSNDSAKIYLQNLKNQKRFFRDLYC